MPRKRQFDLEHVLQKAMHTFWINGYKGTSVRLLEQTMGINQFSIYAAFTSKKQLFLRSLEHFKNYNERHLLCILKASSGDLNDIRLFWERFLEENRKEQPGKGCLFANTALEMGQSDPEIAQCVLEFFSTLETHFRDLLQKSQHRGQLHPHCDIDKLAGYLLTFTEGLAVTTKVMPRSKSQLAIEQGMAFIKGFARL